MDKEQIMIDGVDVKNCRRRIGKNNYCRYFKRLCSENNFNCVWKQLARKTQECEQIKEKYEALKLENQEGYEIVTELKHECEELKKQLMQKDEINTFFNTPIEGWSSDPCGICKYKNCLTEIKEIAEENIRIADLEGLNGVYRRGLAKQIIQKISECEVNND